jgi:hypothetical protein
MAVHPGPIVVVRFESFGVCALGSCVIGANMQCKLFVALQLEVAHHFIERCSGRCSSRSEAPATFRATKTPKPLLLNPYQLPVHGLLSRCALTLSDCMPGSRLASRKRSVLLSPRRTASLQQKTVTRSVAWRKNASRDGRSLNAPFLEGR